MAVCCQAMNSSTRARTCRSGGYQCEGALYLRHKYKRMATLQKGQVRALLLPSPTSIHRPPPQNGLGPMWGLQPQTVSRHRHSPRGKMSPKALGKAAGQSASQQGQGGRPRRVSRSWQMASGKAVQRGNNMCGNVGAKRSVVNLEKGVRECD